MALKKKSPLRSTRLAKKRRNVFLLKLVTTIIAVALLLYAISYVSKLPSLALTHISVEGNSGITTQDIQTLVTEDISGNYIHWLSRSNRFLYPRKQIQVDLENSFKRIQNATLSVYGHELIVSIKEYEPAYVWCSGLPSQTQDQALTANYKQCYFMDIKGYIFSEAPVFSGNAFYEFYGIFQNTAPTGSNYLDPATFQNLNAFITRLKTIGLNSYALLAKANGNNNDQSIFELYLNQPGKIIFKITDDFSNLFTTIQTVRQHSDVFTHIGTSTLEYLDMRFGNKVYYKYNGDNHIQQPN